MICPGEEQLQKLAAGELPLDDIESVMAHLRSCSRCARFVEEYAADQQLAQEYQDVFAGDISLGDVSLSGLLSDTPERIEACLGEPPAPGELPPEGSIPGYKIIREIHRGGQGVVYEAIQLSTKRTVAVKVLLEGPFAGDRSRQRFEREVDLVAHMKHPHIVAIHDSGIALGRYFFAMDYVCGRPLDTHVRVKAPTVRETVRLFMQVCEAVSYAHRHGIIHRDLKPSNILVDQDGNPQVLDFGLAKILSNGREGTHDSLVTLPGQLMGTLHYMSPEQTRGDPDAIDTRTDVYTLGVILYELLAGTVPYLTNADITEALRNIREIDPPSLASCRREVSTDLEAVIGKAMHKDQDRRYLSAGELAEDLRAWLDGRPVTAKSDSSFYILRKLAARHSFETAVLATLILAMGSFAWIGLQGVLYGERMEAERGASDAALRDVDEAQLLAEAGISVSLQHMTLGWFLDEWHAGRTDRAQGIRDQLPAESPERAAMSFLLDELPIERLRAQLPKRAAAMMHFVIGERHAGSGEFDAAKQAFELSLREAEQTSNRWWADTARARIVQLQGTAASGERTALEVRP